jgi:hypothetical protein
MRIQEMRSGIVHLKKRMDGEREAIATVSEPEGVAPREEAAVLESRLDEPVWSVVSFDKLEAGGMTYRQAEELMAALDMQDVPGLCIVTDEAAARTTG